MAPVNAGPPTHRRVALLMGQDLAYNREVLRGIQAYAHAKTDWVIRDGPFAAHVLKPLSEWRPDGIIAHLFERRVAEALGELDVPIVNTTSTLLDLPYPLVDADHFAVGRMAAGYFLDRGFQNFGFFGSSTAGFSRERETGFRDALAERGCEATACYAEYLPRPSEEVSWVSVDERVREWLERLKKPVAILASNDVPARELAEACRQMGLDVPGQVALLGVDNDELECNLAVPPLSSIVLPSQRIGYEAAERLDRMMSGKPAPERRAYLPPVRVAERFSTDTLAIEDPELRAALGFIRSHAHLDIDVEAVHEHTAVSRRMLERRFRERLGRTVLEEIRRTRIELAKRLLTETDLQMPAIAKQAGFSGARRLAVVFRQEVSLTPSEFRDSVRRRNGLSHSDT
ncbi:AraC family transcriptional regulator [Posidoniimonas polymericola]